jgi:hypothetical protein
MKTLTLLFVILLLGSCEKTIFNDQNNDPGHIFDAYWHEIDRNYSFFNYIPLNWDSVYIVYRPKVTPATSNDDLFQILASITDLLHDAHTNVYAPMGVAGNINYFEKHPVNQITLSDAYFSSFHAGNKIFDYGKLSNSNLGYIWIKTFEGDNQNFGFIDTILNTLRDTKGLIIDVRSNRGGFISNCSLVAGRFADSSRMFCRYRIRNGAGHDSFTSWINVYNAPSGKGTHYSKPIVMLTNRRSYSATEWFVAMADVMPNVTIVGDTTGGGSAMPLIRELPNGWILRTSNTQTQLPSGRDFQFTGIYPDVPTWINVQDANKNIDAILEKAITILGR